MRRDGLIAPLLLILAFAASGCRPVVSPPENLDGGPRWSVPSEGSDPLLLRVEPVDGGSVEYFGTRDVDGVPLSLNAVHVTSAENAVTRFTTDAEGRITEVVGPEGAVLSLSYNEEGSLLARFVSPDGSQVFRTEVPYSPPPAAARRAKPARPVLRKEEGRSNPATVAVTGCAGQPDNRAQVTVTWNNGELVREFPARRTGDGLYTAKGMVVPDFDVAAPFWLDVCDNAATVLDLYCDASMDGEVTTTVCLNLATRFPPFAVYLPHCLTAATAGVFSCKTLGMGPIPEPEGPDGHPNVAEQLCSAIRTRARDAWENRDVVVTANVRSRYNPTPDPVGFSTVIQAKDAIPLIHADFRPFEKPTIHSIELDPEVPDARRSYVAEVATGCTPPGSWLELWVTTMKDSGEQVSRRSFRRNLSTSEDRVLRFGLSGGFEDEYHELDAILMRPEGEGSRVLDHLDSYTPFVARPSTVVVTVDGFIHHRCYVGSFYGGTSDWNLTYQLDGPDGPVAAVELTGQDFTFRHRRVPPGRYSVSIVNESVGPMERFVFDGFEAPAALDVLPATQGILRIVPHFHEKDPE